MPTAVRPYATAGVALVGASVIAVAPLAPPPLAIKIPVPHVSASVELTQLGTIISPYVGLVTDTVASLIALGQRVAEFPILSEVIANPSATVSSLVSGLQGLPAGLQTLFSQASLNEIISALQGTVSGLVTGLQGLPAALQTTFGYLATGDINDAVYSLLEYALDSLIGVAFPLLGGLQSVGTAVGTAVGPNIIGETIGALFSQDALLNLGLAPVFPLLAIGQVFADTAQAFYNAITTGNFATAAGILLTAPAVFTNSFLNGYPLGMITASGLLTSDFGTFADLLNIRDDVAAAIASVLDPMPALAPSAPSTLPNVAANTVTVNTAQMKTPAPTGTKDPTIAPTVGSGPLTKLLTPLNSTATTTAPTTARLNGNKVAPGMLGGATPSGGLKGGSGYIPKHAK